MHIINNILRTLLLSLLFVSCSDSTVLPELDRIEKIGDKDAKRALSMLGSLSIDVKESSIYCQMKYELLKVRFQDKDSVILASNKAIRRLVRYFDKEGTPAEKQEAFYYAGSVYCDHDTQRAMDYFSKSLAVSKTTKDCDSMMLGKAYSNLSYLFYREHDYANALYMARQEYGIAKQIHKNTICAAIHLGNSYMDCCNEQAAKEKFDEALAAIASKNASESGVFVYALLLQYSQFNDMDKAQKCFEIIRSAKNHIREDFAYNAMAEYYAALGLPDSSAAYYRKIIDNDRDEYNVYDASKALFRIYWGKGDAEEVNKYGNQFVFFIKELEISENQKLVATVNNRYRYNLYNKYRYNRDREYVQKAERNSILYMYIVVAVLAFCILLAFSFLIFYILKRYKFLKQQLVIERELGNTKTKYETVRSELTEKTHLLNEMKAELAASTEQLRHSNADIDRYTADLQKAKEELAEKRRQSQTLMQMLHRTEFSVQAEDVVISVKEAARGKRKLEGDDWLQLYAAVDSLYPGFRDILTERIGTFSEQQMQVCYLMRIGLNNPQIKNVSDVPRTTIWRWTKAYGWIYGLPGAQ